MPPPGGVRCQRRLDRSARRRPAASLDCRLHRQRLRRVRPHADSGAGLAPQHDRHRHRMRVRLAPDGPALARADARERARRADLRPAPPAVPAGTGYDPEHMTTRVGSPPPAAPPGFIDTLRAIVGDEWLYTDPHALAVYECDGLTHARETPLAVALPADAGQVRSLVVACAEAGVPFVARGHGTGLSGGAQPVPGGIVIGLARLNRILHVDLANQLMTVEPGVTNLDITRHVAPY